MDTETWIAFLTLLGGREIVSFLLNRRKSQADVRATDAGAAAEISGAAQIVVGISQEQIDVMRIENVALRNDASVFASRLDDLLVRVKQGDAFKFALESKMNEANDARRVLEEKVAQQGVWIDDLQRRLQDSGKSLNELRGLKPAMTHLAEEVVYLQDGVKTLKAENKELRGHVERLKEENAELRQQMNGRPDTTKSAN